MINRNTIIISKDLRIFSAAIPCDFLLKFFKVLNVKIPFSLLMRSLSHTQNTNYNSKQNAKEKKI
jgi:hypothetical protein